MRRETKSVIGAAIAFACVLWPAAGLAQDEGPRFVQLPNPMAVHTWFIIVAVGAFLAWCISYVLDLQRDRLSSKPERETLLRQKELLLDRLAELELEKNAGKLSPQRYEKEYKKARGKLSDVVGRLSSKAKPEE